MERSIHHEQEICQFMADAYTSKILSATYRKALSVPQISKICEIPVATAYRQVKKMASIGLLACVREEVGSRGKKEKLYYCAIEKLRYAFDKGNFTCLMCLEAYQTDFQMYEEP